MVFKEKNESLFEYIKANHRKKSARTIAKELGISPTTVRRKAKSIGIEFEHNATLRIASSELDKDIKDQFYKEASISIATRHRVSEKTVNKRALELGLKPKLASGRDGNKKEFVEYIALQHGKMTNQSIADELNISRSRVNRILNELELIKKEK
jgi:transcriptional antiterminator